MAIYDGVVSLSDSSVPVIIELGEDSVRLSADGTEIGEWSIEECDITREDETTYLIHAEAESLPFTPTQPGAFGAAVGLVDEKASVALPPGPVAQKASAEAPPPKPLTVGLFYVLVFVTLALGVWAVVSIAF